MGELKMKNLLKTGLAAVLLSTVAITAHAADAVEEPFIAAAPVAVYDWSGFYAGASLGWIGLRPNPAAANLIQPNSSGFTGGVFAGYNVQSGSFVFGAEADINFNTASATAPCFNPAFTCNAQTDWNGSVRLRAGAAADRVHAYLTGGLAFADYNGFTQLGAVRFASRRTLTGWTAGAGVEYAVTQNLIIGFEALYTDLGNTVMAYDAPYAVRPNFTTVKFRAAYKF